MSQNSIRITNLSPKANEFNLKTIFSLNGPVLKVTIFEDANGSRCADLMFENEQAALSSFEEFNEKEILRKKVTIRLLNNQNSAFSSNSKLDRELIGEIVYPIAFRLYALHAPKITGMLVQSILQMSQVKPVNELQELLNSREAIVDLVEAAYKKLLNYN